MARRPIAGPDDLVAVFMPSLAAQLAQAERAQKRHLTPTEINAIRDAATVMMMSREKAAELTKARGYDDIDAEHAAQRWAEVREQLKDAVA